MSRRGGFTLVELLVSIALTLFILSILAHAFALGTDTFTTLKAVGDLNNTLRTAANILRADLIADHFEGKRRLSDSRFFIDGPPLQGYVFIYTPPQSAGDEGTDADGLPLRRRTEHILAFTVKLRGNKRQDYFSALVPATPLPTLGSPAGRFQDDTIYPGGMKLFNSQWAEVCYFMKPVPVPPGSPPLFALYRQQRLVVADVDKLNWSSTTDESQLGLFRNAVSCMKNPNAAFNTKIYFNSPSDLTIPERRTTGDFRPLYLPSPNTAAFAASFKPQTELADPSILTGGDLLLTDVLTFDVQAMCIPVLATPAQAALREFTDIPSPFHYDTWSRRVDDSYDYSDPAHQAVFTGQNYRIVALHITLRVWDSKSQLARQITIIQDM